MKEKKYKAFEGITVVYWDVHRKEALVTYPASDQFIEISHCREGRVELESSGEFVYLGSGDMAITVKKQACENIRFPMGHYHGISVFIDLKKAPMCFSSLLSGVEINPKNVVEKLCQDDSSFVVRADESVQRIFLELYRVPEDIRMAYCKVKVLELLLWLGNMDFGKVRKNQPLVTESQASLAREVYEYLCKNLERKVTLDELTLEFCVSGTLLKNVFKKVYGVPVSTFIRNHKMEMAAIDLETTDMTVSEIAGIYGYDNSSKFSEAFKKIKGIAPGEYRNNCKNV